MNHLRVAIYDVLSGTPQEVSQTALQPDGMLEIFQSMPGFKAYSLLEVSPTEIMSISAWDTHGEAEEAIAAAAEWVATHIAHLIKRKYNTSASALFWEGAIA
ncbi:unannotated protein [freshwater metagenome]|uniref:Unannotated protein n=1 Tax=freshwater metagenome TaxID=449393 RepID=A0A6J7CRQ5_9ZZZZ|nr:hypothetical protein [Actinomycetota bacterium]